MKDIIRNAFKALDELVDVKIETAVIKPLKKTLTEAFDDVDMEEKTLKDLFKEAGSYVLTHDFEHGGLIYSLFIEGLNDGEACDILFDEFDVKNINEVLIELLDEERNFIETLSEGHTEWDNLDTQIGDVIEVASESLGEPDFLEEEKDKKEIGTREKIAKHMVTDHGHAKEENLKEAVGGAEFFPGKDGDIAAAEFVEEKNLKDYKVEWDKAKDGYLITWGAGSQMEEGRVEGRQKFKKDAKLYQKTLKIKTEDLEGSSQLPEMVVIDGSLLVDDGVNLEDAYLDEVISDWLSDNYGFTHLGFNYEVKDGMVYVTGIQWDTNESLKESKQFNLKDKEKTEEAKEVLDANKEEEEVEQIVDVNADTVDDLKKTYIGSTILQCQTCKTMIYKDPKDLVEPEEVQADGEKLYNVDEECPHCGAADGFELIGQVAALNVNPEEKPEPPMVEPQPAAEASVEQPAAEEKPSEEPAPEQPQEETVEVVAAEAEEPAEEIPAEEKPAEEATAEEKPKEKGKKKEKMVTLMPEEEVKESLKESNEKNWGVYQSVDYYKYKHNPGLKIGFVVTGLAKEEAEKKAKEMNTEANHKNGLYYRAAEVVAETEEAKYEKVAVESFDTVKFDRLAKKYLNEVYSNIESYATTHGEVDNEKNTITMEGLITFRSGKTKTTKFVFEAREITKKGKMKLVGINETFAKKKAFTLVGSILGTNMLSESLTYSYKLDDKKVYGQVKNPVKK